MTDLYHLEISRLLENICLDDRKKPKNGSSGQGSSRVRGVLEPFERWPQSGARLKEAFLGEDMESMLRHDITEFIRHLEGSYHNGKKKTLQKLDKDSLETIWQSLARPEYTVYQKSITEASKQAFLKRWGTGYEMHHKLCKPSGIPEQVLHVILDCPTIRTCTHLDHPPLDPKNKSMNALLKKGLGSDNCFVFDSFPRRVTIPDKSASKIPREIWPEFKLYHDMIHMEYRKRGGAVTLVMGNNAEKAWRDVLHKERITAEKLFPSAGFDVWGEYSRTDPIRRISRIVIKVKHPGYFTSYGKQKSSVTISMDNGINFAFALAGVLELRSFKSAYFTENFSHSYSFLSFYTADRVTVVK